MTYRFVLKAIHTKHDGYNLTITLTLTHNFGYQRSTLHQAKGQQLEICLLANTGKTVMLINVHCP